MKNWEKLIKKKYWRKEEKKNLRFIKTITINNKKKIHNKYIFKTIMWKFYSVAIFKI